MCEIQLEMGWGALPNHRISLSRETQPWNPRRAVPHPVQKFPILNGENQLVNFFEILSLGRHPLLSTPTRVHACKFTCVYVQRCVCTVTITQDGQREKHTRKGPVW